MPAIARRAHSSSGGDSKDDEEESRVLASPVAPEAPAKDEGPVQLKRRLTLWNGVAIIVGTVVGSGAFVSPTGVLQEMRGAPGPALVVWTVSGILSAAGAICYAELGTCLTGAQAGPGAGAGGDYAYIRAAFGPLPAFLRLWVALLIIRPTTQAVVAITFANYAAKPFFTGGCDPPENSIRLLAAACLLFLTAINCISVRWAMKIQDVFTAAKVAALVVIILAGIVYIGRGGESHLTGSFETPQDFASICFAFYSGLFAYGGWNYLNFVTEELQEPHKNLPRAILIAMPLITLIYVLTNMAYFAVVPTDEMLASPAVAVSFGYKALGPLAWAVPVFVSLSTFGGVNGILFTSARLFHAGSCQGHLPALFSFIHVERATPIPALIFTCITSVAMLTVSDVFALINYFSVILWGSSGACVAGLIVLRWTKPDLNRPLRAPLSLAILFLVACSILVIVPTIQSPMNTVISLVITLSGVPVYYFCVVRKANSKTQGKFMQKITYYSQILLDIMGVEPEESKQTTSM
ncbi:large neutral amino acids transporter small subunit 1 isoform X2 [Ischnura elegans]|nr:large neutral amino acids transporter small subunit 1 isoform X2 [Ischnura elegans]